MGAHSDQAGPKRGQPLPPPAPGAPPNPSATAGIEASSPDGPGGWLARPLRWFFTLRGGIAWWQPVVAAGLCLATVLLLWWSVTRGVSEERVLSRTVLPSPTETFSSFHELWFERELTRNIWASLRRVLLGFGLATLIGVPLGVLCGCFAWINAFFMPVSIFGRNIPIAALIPLTFALFGIGEIQKVMFIFIAAVAFILSDTARAIIDVDGRYVDTAYTLGSSRWQIILKVLVPLALPDVFNSLRLLFGLAFGYIMLAELVKFGGESGGLGDIINMSQRRGEREHILLVLIIIPLVALAIDRIFFWLQRELFPHRYGGMGLLNRAVRATLHGWEDLKRAIYVPAAARQHMGSGFPVQPADQEGGS